MTNTHATIENVEKLATLIVSKYSIDMDSARDLAEFNLNFSSTYEEAASRV